jgi:diaminopimelate decarboxylase
VTSQLAEIANEIGTPFYAYDADAFRSRIASLEAAIGGLPHLVCYSAKANDALALLRIAADAGLGVDIVSGGELWKARRAGVPAERIVFSGVGKRRDEIRDALDAGVRSINVESPGELDVIAEEAQALGTRAPVSVRLNPGVAVNTHEHIATGHAGAKFGLPAEVALAQLQRAAVDQALEPVGIAFHLGSQLFDVEPVLAALDQAADVWREAAAGGVVLRDLDLGGGMGIPYDGGTELDLAAYVAAVEPTARVLGATLVLEPGRFLVAPVGTFVTRVLYVKELPGVRVAVCDGGMNDFIRPVLYGAFHPIEVLGATAGRERGAVDVVGPICESADYFARSRALPLPEPGDLMAIGYAGAYGRVMSSTYNARPFCAEVLLEAGGWRISRDAGSYGDLVRGESA